MPTENNDAATIVTTIYESSWAPDKYNPGIFNCYGELDYMGTADTVLNMDVTCCEHPKEFMKWRGDVYDIYYVESAEVADYIREVINSQN